MLTTQLSTKGNLSLSIYFRKNLFCFVLDIIYFSYFYFGFSFVILGFYFLTLREIWKSLQQDLFSDLDCSSILAMKETEFQKVANIPVEDYWDSFPFPYESSHLDTNNPRYCRNDGHLSPELQMQSRDYLFTFYLFLFTIIHWGKCKFLVGGRRI